MTRRPFAALVAAEAFSISGTRLSMIAIPWLVLSLTGDAVLTGLVAFAEMTPYVVAKALGGPLIDRLGPRRIAVLGDLGSLLAIAMVPLVWLAGFLDVMVLVPLVALLGVLRGPADAAKQAMIPAVARAGDLPLERMTGVIGTIERLASMVGAAAAGALIAAIGATAALGFTAACFGLSAAIIVLGLGRSVMPERAEVPAQGYGRDLMEGFAFLRGNTVLVAIAVMIALTNFFDQAFAVVLVPVWALEHGHGAEIVGLVFAVFSGCSMLGAILAAALAERLPRLPVYVGAFLVVGLPRFLVLALDVPLAGVLAVMALGGFASGFLNPIISAVILERIPERLVGRVSSLVTASAWALMPFGGLAAGALIAGVGLQAALLACGCAYLAITLAPLRIRSFRGFSERPIPGA